MSAQTRRIMRLLYLTQAASDGGKGIYELPSDSGIAHMSDHSRGRYTAAYAAKDACMMQAIELICRSHSRDVRFCVTYADGEWNDTCYLVYFDFKVDGRREQVSFHSFNDGLRRFVRNSRRSTWSKDRSSRDTVRLAAKAGVSPRDY